jgi:hypothetical protein
MMDIELQLKFDEAIRPVVKLLQEEMHPHSSVVITTAGFEVVEAVYGNMRMIPNHDEEDEND